MASFHEAVFRATHNSYEHGRGTIAEQLDSGVRFLEIDVHDAEYLRHGYRIGHNWPGDAVGNGGGNPASDRLEDWLAAIAEWSGGHDRHAPITVTLDAKNDLTDGESHSAGNFAALNELLRRVFGERLLAASDLGEADWPPLEELRGRILCVLSGSHDGRLGYARDGGYEPAVAVAPSGVVVEAHASGSGGLWYWTGRQAEGRVRWARHGRYSAGGTPAVAVADGGAVVSVHGAPGNGAACCVGRLDPGTLEIDWSESSPAPLPAVASNPFPHVRLTGEDRLRVTYESSHGRMAFGGRLRDGSIDWDDDDSAGPATAADARFHRDHAAAGDVEISVVSVHDGSTGTKLLYGTGTVDADPIRYEQVLFVEGKGADGPFVHDLEPVLGPHDPRFYATGGGGGSRPAWGRALRDAGKLVRFWGFEEADTGRDFVPSFPACDHPSAGWYTRYCDENGALEPGR